MSVHIRFRKLKDGSKRPFLDIYHNGNRTKESLDLVIFHGDALRKEKMKLIENLKSVRELEILKDEYDFEGRKKKKIDFVKYFEEFIKNYQGKDYRLVDYSFRRFKKILTKKRLPLEELTPDLCERFANFF